MKQSKAFRLLQALSDKEQKMLLKSAKEHKRMGVRKLLHVLLEAKDTREPDSPEVYKLVFNKKYTKANDYLLRNEYRLLYEWLWTIITQDEKVMRIDDTTVMNKLLQLRAYDLFEEEFAAAWRKNLETDNVEALLALSNIHIQYHLIGKPQTLQNGKETVALCQQRIGLLKTDFLRKIRAEEIRLKMSERLISAYEPVTPSDTINTISLAELEVNDLCAQYLHLRARINFARGEEKIQLLNNVLSQKDIINKYENCPDEAICRFLINLAQEYYLASAFTDAVSYYQMAYEYFDAVHTHVQETLAMNYIMALMHSDMFEQAKQLVSKHQALLLQSNFLAGRSPFLMAVLYLHTRDADKAEKFVQLEVRKEGTEFYYFMRLVLSAVYYLRGDLDFALRETINIDQAVNYEMNREQTLQTKISKPIVSFFRRFYKVVQTKTKDKLKDELCVLQTEICESLQTNSDQSPNSILIRWLNKEISNLVC